MTKNNIMVGSLVMLMLFISNVHAEETHQYTNYAITDFVKEDLEKEFVSHYDLFGRHIVDGDKLYETKASTEKKYFSTLLSLPDSTYNISSDFRNNLFYINLNNLAITNDVYGGIKSALIMGDQIRTQFTPLSMNMRNYDGLRWDLWREGLGFTFLMNRTRPSVAGIRGSLKPDRAGPYNTSFVTFPTSGWLYFGERAQRGDWINKEENDWTIKTMFGDYSMFWGFHGQKQFKNLSLGLTLMNHHQNDIKYGERWFGEVPEEFVPDEIHFEIYDLTPDIVSDAGARVHNITMLINGKPEGGPGGRYTIDRGDTIRLVSSGPMFGQEAHGETPLIYAFYPQQAFSGTGEIKEVSFKIDLEGNYLIFVSTEKFTPLYKHWNKFLGPDQNRLADLDGVPIDRGKRVINPLGNTFPDLEKSEVFFGDYIARSPKYVKNYGQNRTTINYNYEIIISSIVYGVNVDGELYGLDVSGEIKHNESRSKFPSKNGSVTTNRYNAGYLQVTKPFSEKMSLRGDVYNIDSRYEPNLPHYQVSRAFSKVENLSLLVPHYQDYPIQLSNYWTPIDDNDDNDYWVENNRRQYPNNIADNSKGSYFADGSIRSPKNEKSGGKSPNFVMLPTGFKKIYDDDDGVIQDRFDRNKNGLADYREDFLLFEADQPFFSLDPDRNNNGIFDVEEDDLLPDYPYSIGYVFTSNGIRSLGIRGLSTVFRYFPADHVDIEAGGVFESVLDPNLDGSTDQNIGANNYGRNFGVYGVAKYNKTDRERGITYFAGEELKKVNDGIRNDAIQGRVRGSYIQFSAIADRLERRNALVSNTALGIKYEGIKNFMFASKMYGSLEKHLEEGGDLYSTRTLNDSTFESSYIPYRDRLIRSIIYLTKMSYDFKFTKKLEGPLAYFNFLNRIILTPQYKIMYEFTSTAEDDPRRVNTGITDPLSDVLEWRLFRDNNRRLLLSVPIIRLSYKVGEKTLLEFGQQWKREADFILEEASFLKTSSVMQIISQNSYSGYDIAIQFGVSYSRLEHDINSINTRFQYGRNFNEIVSNIFLKIYMGI